ncbi:Uncharacterised protein [Mycobacteroides abscessus]|nr:Uncharacterised protein [Mycobacteroides abscessus]
MLRSVQSVNAVSFSAPITTAVRAEPPRIAWSARPTEWAKPEHATFTSSTAGPTTPRRSSSDASSGVDCPGMTPVRRWYATRPAVLGERSVAVAVATMTRSTSAGSTPASSSAWRAAAVAMSATVVSSSATCRVTMPVRERIHSSLVSTSCAMSSFVSVFSGWK